MTGRPGPRLHRVTVEDVASALPEARPFPGDGAAEEFDLYLGALGFEERCLTVPRLLARRQARVRAAVFAEYDTNVRENEANRGPYEAALGAVCARVTGLGTGVRHYEKQLTDVLDAEASRATGALRVLLDTSVASNHLVMSTLKLLLDQRRDVVLTVAYAEADRYHPTRQEFELNPDRWVGPGSRGLEAGVGEIDVMVQYPGYHVDGLPDSVVVIPGWGRDRARAAISWVNPSFLASPGDRLVWVLGRPLHSEDAWRHDALALINDVGESRTLDVDTFDYRRTLVALDRLFEELSGQRQLTLVPLGSKMQALGCAVFCYRRPEVRVVFATPASYRGSLYSAGTRQVWRVDLGSLRELADRVDGIGHLRLVRDR